MGVKYEVKLMNELMVELGMLHKLPNLLSSIANSTTADVF